MEQITVLGSGTMGHGIAQVAAGAGLVAVLHDVDAAALDRARAAIRRNLDLGIEKGKVTAARRDDTLARIRTATGLGEAVAGSELVIEAVPEDLALKQRIFTELDRLTPPETLLATNTSSLPIAAVARATRRPDRVIGMHFFNPVHIMALLEIVRGEATSGATLDAVRALGERMGKTCIVVRDAPGFATSRLGVVLGLEAIRMLEQEVASAEDIDTAMTLGYRHPVGPLRLTDLVGLDVRLAIAEHLHRTLGSEAFSPPALLKRLVAEGKLGRKTGQGFYPWES